MASWGQDPSAHQAPTSQREGAGTCCQTVQAQAGHQRMGAGGERKGGDGNQKAQQYEREGRGGLITEELPGCRLCREVASDRTRAGGQGVSATLGKWSEGARSGPACLLKIMFS